MPKVSVIVPMYNLQNYIEKCLESLINQSLSDIEIIVIDDGSTDRSVDVVSEYMLYDSRIRLIRKINGGVSSARNMGIKAAVGEYILMVDADDWLERDCLLDAYGLAKSECFDAVFFDYYSVSDSKRLYIQDINIKDQEVISGKEYLQRFFEERFINPTICNKLVLTSLYKEHGLNPEGIKMCEDLATIGKLMFYCKRVGKISNAYYNYFKRSDSVVHNVTEEHLIDRARVMYLLEQFYKKVNASFMMDFEKYEILQLIQYLYCIYVDDSSDDFQKCLNKYLDLNKRHKTTHRNFNILICGKILHFVPSGSIFMTLRKLKHIKLAVSKRCFS